MRTLHASVTAEKNALDSTSAWLPLLTVWVTPDAPLHLVPNPVSVTFNGITYVPFGLTLGDVSYDSQGGLSDLSVTVSNVTREIGAYVELHDLRGALVDLLYVNSKYLDDPTAIVSEEHYEITAISVDGDTTVTFVLGHERLLSSHFPAARFLRDYCRWIYKSVECGATGLSTGRGTLSSAGFVVSGVGTNFLTQCCAGDTLTAAAQAVVVDMVLSDTAVTVTMAPSPVWDGETYTVTKPTCSKLLGGGNGCRAHANSARYGGFPLIPSVAGRLT